MTPLLPSGDRAAIASIVWWAVVGLVAVPAMALDPAKLPSQYIHHRWQDELPQSHVQDIVQTRDGYLWIATQEGLARFDGRRFVVFTARNAGLDSDFIRVLHEDSDGGLWIGTRGGGLSRYARGRFEKIDAPALVAASVHALAVDPTNALWVGTADQGLWRRDDRGWHRVGEAGFPADTVLALLADGDDLWVGTRKHGLWRHRDGELERYSLGAVAGGAGGENDRLGELRRALGEDSILSLLRDRRGTLWVGTLGHGLAELGASPRLFGVGDGLPSPAVKALLEDEDGILWVGTYGGGLARRAADGWLGWGAEDGLGSDVVLSLFEDRESSLWIGTEGGGLDRLMDATFTPFGVSEGLGANYVWTVLAGRDGELWIGTEGGGLARMLPSADGPGAAVLELITTADGLASDSITSLHQDRRGDLWIGTRGAGLHRLRDPRAEAPVAERLDLYTTAEGLSSDTILSLWQDAAGTLWVGTLGGGIDRFAGDRFEPLAAGGIDDATVLALATDARDRLLAGTNGQGLRRLDAEGLTAWTTADGLAHDTVLTLHQAADGTLWVGTFGGLSRIRDGEVASFTTDHGLISDAIFQLLEDDRGWLWMCGNQGVFAVEREALDAVVRGARERVEPLHLGIGDGMRSAECNGGGQPSGVRTADGRLWFATVRGVAAMHPRRILRNRVAPLVVIESVLVDGEPLAEEGGIELPPGIDRLEVAYTGNSFRAPEEVRFRYRLEGFDRDWIEAGDQRRATYTNLPTGRRYRFEVQAANEDGAWSPRGAAFELEIGHHVWETPWFILLALVAAGLAVRAIYGLRVRRLLRRTEELESKIAERTREVVAQKDELARANRELEKLNQIKSEFLAIAAHDIKNPLSLIYGYAGLIAERGGGRSRLRSIGTSISASAQRILNIVTDLLDTTAIESGKLTLHVEDTDLEELTTAAVERNRPLAEEREMKLRFTTGGDEPVSAPVDRERLGRVLDNLIGNAVKYAPRRSTVHIALACRDGRARIEVRDEGPGIPAGVRERIFERFERLGEPRRSERAPSTGLGLSIVKHFVELHHGRVWVESTPGEGATFVVELPTQRPSQQRSSRST